MAEGRKLLAQNKTARFNYSIEDSIECGIVLEGTEVKSFRAGNISFPDAFAEIRNGEVWVRGLHVAEYSFSLYLITIQTVPKNFFSTEMKSSVLFVR